MASQLPDLPPEVLALITIFLKASQWFPLWLTGSKALIRRMSNGGVKDLTHVYGMKTLRAKWPTVIRSLRGLESLSLSCKYLHRGPEPPTIRNVDLAALPKELRRLRLDITPEEDTFPTWWASSQGPDSYLSESAADGAATEGQSPGAEKEFLVFPQLEYLELGDRFTWIFLDHSFEFPDRLRSLRLDTLASHQCCSERFLRALPASLVELHLTTSQFFFPIIQMEWLPRNLTALTSPHRLSGNGASLPPGLKTLNVGGMQSSGIVDTLVLLLPQLPHSITDLMDLPEFSYSEHIQVLPPTLTRLNTECGFHWVNELCMAPPALTELNLDTGTPDARQLVMLPLLRRLACSEWPYNLKGENRNQGDSFDAELSPPTELSDAELLALDMNAAPSYAEAPIPDSPLGLTSILPHLTELSLLHVHMTPTMMQELPPQLLSLSALYPISEDVFSMLPPRLTDLHFRNEESLDPLHVLKHLRPSDCARFLPRTLISLNIGPVWPESPTWYHQLPRGLKSLELWLQSFSETDLIAISETLPCIASLTFRGIRSHPSTPYGALFRHIPRSLLHFRVVKVHRRGLAGLKLKEEHISTADLNSLPRVLETFDIPIPFEELYRCLQHLKIQDELGPLSGYHFRYF